MKRHLRAWCEPLLVVLDRATAGRGSKPPALAALIKRHGDRFAIRFSNAPFPFAAGPTTITIESPKQKPADAILCPEQIGKTESCSTCALCWHTKKRIAFIQH